MLVKRDRRLRVTWFLLRFFLVMIVCFDVKMKVGLQGIREMMRKGLVGIRCCEEFVV